MHQVRKTRGRGRIDQVVGHPIRAKGHTNGIGRAGVEPRCRSADMGAVVAVDSAWMPGEQTLPGLIHGAMFAQEAVGEGRMLAPHTGIKDKKRTAFSGITQLPHLRCMNGLQSIFRSLYRRCLSCSCGKKLHRLQLSFRQIDAFHLRQGCAGMKHMGQRFQYDGIGQVELLHIAHRSCFPSFQELKDRILIKPGLS